MFRLFVLIYGADGTGKSVQCKQIAESNENPVVLSLATKNRALYKESGVPVGEILQFNEDSTVNPYKTIDKFQEAVDRIIKENTAKLVVIDEITLLRKFAQPVVLEEINKTRRADNKRPLTKIGEENYGAWEKVNNIVYGHLERLANWSVINEATIIAITSITEERRLVPDDDGKLHSQTTGKWICDVKINIRKLADVIIKLEKDGSRGKGYWAFIEKTQDWMGEGKGDVIKIDKNGLLTEFMVRGVIE